MTDQIRDLAYLRIVVSAIADGKPLAADDSIIQAQTDRDYERGFSIYHTSTEHSTEATSSIQAEAANLAVLFAIRARQLGRLCQLQHGVLA